MKIFYYKFKYNNTGDRIDHYEYGLIRAINKEYAENKLHEILDFENCLLPELELEDKTDEFNYFMSDDPDDSKDYLMLD